MDNFFYNLNKKMANLAKRQDLAESAVTERDQGKHNNATTGFKAVAKKAAKEYGSKAAGERVAGAQFQKMKKAGMAEMDNSTLKSYRDKANKQALDIDAALDQGRFTKKGKSELVNKMVKRDKGVGRANAKLASRKLSEDLQADDGEYYKSADDFFSQFEADHFEQETTSTDGMEIRGYIDGKCVMAWQFDDESMTGGYGNYDDSSLMAEQGMEESAFQAAIGKKKYGEKGMKALQKAGREQASDKTMSTIRNRYDRYNEAESMSLDEADMEEGNEFSGNREAAIKAGKPTFTVGNKTYRVTGNTSDEKKMEEGAFKTQDIDRQEREMKKSPRGLNQVPGMQNNKPHTREHPLKNVARGVKAFVQGKPEPMDEEKESRSKGTAFDPDTRKQMKTDQEGTGNFDKKKISTGTVYTRRHKEDDEEEVKSNEPKKKGRPKGPAKGPERVTAKSYKYKQGRPVKENGIAITDRGEYDDEAGMAQDQLNTIVRHARELERAIGAGDNLPEWVQEKMGQIKGMMSSVTDYMLSQKERGIEDTMGREGIRIAEDVTMSTGAIQQLWQLATALKGYIQDPDGTAVWQEMAQIIKGYKDAPQQNIAEKAVSVKQRRAAGIAHAAQKGEIPKKELRGASKAMAKMPAGELTKFAATKEKGLPKKVKEGGKPDFLDLDKDGNKTEPMKQAAKQTKGKKKEVDETTTSGSVAVASSAAPKGKSGMSFGKGVYEGAVNESYQRKLTAILNEGMNVSVNMTNQDNGAPNKSINISADGEDAEKLAEILKLAGLGSQSSGCSSCGQSSCGCSEQVDENQPDWPTNTATTDGNDPYLHRFSGGLNGAKSTGQTTVPVVASQARRQVSMEESVALERSLFNTWKNYKG